MVYYKTSGIYQRSVKYLSTLYRYDWLLIPYIDDGANVNKALTDFAKASKYYDNSYIPKICGEIALKTIINGIYYGYVLDNGEGLAIQELPIEYCRSRFSVNGNPIVEFNMKYFDDMKYDDIAEVLDVAVGTLKATYHNAVKKIEESLKISDTLPSFEQFWTIEMDGYG